MHDELRSLMTNGWKNSSGCDTFSSSIICLSSSELITQIKKANDFLAISIKTLEQHFEKCWTKSLLFLALAGEAPTARVLACIIIGKKDNSDLQPFYSTCHGKNIDLESFRHFLKERCTTISSVQVSAEISGNVQAIHKIAEGGDMWSENSDDLLMGFREKFLLLYSSLPTNTHEVESGVKNARYCTVQGRSEQMRSTYALARSQILEDVSCSQNDMEIAERKDVRGKSKACAAMSSAVRRHSILSEMDMEQVNNLKVLLTDKDSQFSKCRVEKMKGRFLQWYDRDKRPNKLQSQCGVHETPFTKGHIPLFKLKKWRDLDSLKFELQARSLSIDGNWKTLLSRMKEYEGMAKHFRQRTDVIIPWWDEDAINPELV